MDTPLPWTPLTEPPKISRFFPSPAPFSLYFSLSGGIPVELWPRVAAMTTQIARLGYFVKPRRPVGRRGSHKMTPDPNAQIGLSMVVTRGHSSTRTTRERKQERILVGEGTERESLGPPTLRKGPTLRGPPLRGSTPSVPHSFGPATLLAPTLLGSPPVGPRPLDDHCHGMGLFVGPRNWTTLSLGESVTVGGNCFWMKVSVTFARHAPKTHTRCIDTWNRFSVLICDVRLDFMIRVRGLCQSPGAVDLPAGAAMVGEVQLGILIVRCPTAAEAGRAGSLKSSCDSSRISSSAGNRQTILRVFIFDVCGKFPGRDLQSYGTQEKFHARAVDGISIGFRSHSGLGKLAWRKSDREPFFLRFDKG